MPAHHLSFPAPSSHPHPGIHTHKVVDDHSFCLPLSVQSLVCLSVQLIIPSQPEPNDMISTLLQVQSISAACRMGQKDVDLSGIPIILIPCVFQLPDTQLCFLERLQQPDPVMLEIVKHQCRLPCKDSINSINASILQLCTSWIFRSSS